MNHPWDDRKTRETFFFGLNEAANDISGATTMWSREGLRVLRDYLASIWFGGTLRVGFFYEVEGWLEKPLPAGRPWTWAMQEHRVEWLRANLTDGEKALLYRLAHDVDNLRVADCKGIERREKEALARAQP